MKGFTPPNLNKRASNRPRGRVEPDLDTKIQSELGLLDDDATEPVFQTTGTKKEKSKSALRIWDKDTKRKKESKDKSMPSPEPRKSIVYSDSLPGISRHDRTEIIMPLKIPSVGSDKPATPEQIKGDTPTGNTTNGAWTYEDPKGSKDQYFKSKGAVGLWDATDGTASRGEKEKYFKSKGAVGLWDVVDPNEKTKTSAHEDKESKEKFFKATGAVGLWDMATVQPEKKEERGRSMGSVIGGMNQTGDEKGGKGRAPLDKEDKEKFFKGKGAVGLWDVAPPTPDSQKADDGKNKIQKETFFKGTGAVGLWDAPTDDPQMIEMRKNVKRSDVEAVRTDIRADGSLFRLSRRDSSRKKIDEYGVKRKSRTSSLKKYCVYFSF
jgi:hypothetical protein